MPITASEGSKAFSEAKANLDDLIKRRFFYRQAFEIYGGVGGFYTYGPPGSAVKQNLINLWRKHFVIEENLMEVDDTNIMPHDVLFTSGHVERFNDFIVKDTGDPNKFYRADKLLEEIMDAKLAEKDVTEEKRVEFTRVKAQADAFSKEEITEVFKTYAIKAPETGNELTDPQEFNLMFPVPIGPSGNLGGYLRPETAQGIFLNFKFCLEQNANNMPFGIAQVGKAFRNEIAPRSGLIRTREFTQAEIEFFVHPEKKAHPKFAGLASLSLQLFPSGQQLAAEAPVFKTLGDAVSEGMVANETLGFFIGRTYLFLVRAGCKPEHIRFRQHLPDEMAHYACDCWDAELEMSLGWVECVGIADRSAYDLTVHSKATGVSLTAQTNLAEPRIVETFGMSKKAIAGLGKVFKKDAKKVTEALTAMSSDELKALEAAGKADGKATITCDGQSFDLPADLLVFESKTVKTSVDIFTPNVIEPSFGIDRILTAIFEHTFYVREKGEEGDKVKPGVLAFPAEVAPYKAVVLPLDMRVVKDYGELLAQTRLDLASFGLPYKVDESGASIGKRYARSDELGIPYAITIDFDTLGKSTDGSSALAGIATLRDRDSTQQVRLPLVDIPGYIAKLSSAHPLTFDDLVAAYGSITADATPPAPTDKPSDDALTYLSQHHVTQILNAAVNKLTDEKPADPIAFLVAELSKKK